MTAALTRPTVRIALGTGAALAAGLTLPYLVHLFPLEAGPPAGARLLPIFVAVVFIALRMGAAPVLAVALAQPLLNRTVTGMPEGAMVGTLTAELVLVGAALLALRRFAPKAAPFAAAPAYLLAAALVNAVATGQGPLATWAFAFSFQLPGLALLVVTGLAAAYGRRDPDRAPDRAPDRPRDGA